MGTDMTTTGIIGADGEIITEIMENNNGKGGEIK